MSQCADSPVLSLHVVIGSSDEGISNSILDGFVYGASIVTIKMTTRQLRNLRHVMYQKTPVPEQRPTSALRN